MSELSERDATEDANLGSGESNSLTFWAIKEYLTLSDSLKHALSHFLLEAAKSIVDVVNGNQALTPARKHNCKKLLYYFVQHCHVAESSKSKEQFEAMGKAKGGKKKKAADDHFDWTVLRRQCLASLHQLISSNISVLWTMSIVEESFTHLVWSYALDLLETRPLGMSGSTQQDASCRATCVEIIAKTTKYFGNSLSSASFAALCTASIDALLRTEHMCGQVAELCKQEAAQPHSNHVLTSEVFAEVSQMNMNMVPSQGVKHIGLFIESFARLSPQVLAQLFPLVIKLVDSPAHQIRSAMVQAMGSIVAFVHSEVQKDAGAAAAEEILEQGADKYRTNLQQLSRLRDSLLNMIVERTHDTNPYTRSNVLKTWSSLLEQRSLPVRRVGSVAEVAVDRLQDRNYLVRRQAIVLLSAVIEVNPFAGQLDRNVFAAQQEELSKHMESRKEELRLAAEEEKAKQAEIVETSEAAFEGVGGNEGLGEDEGGEDEDQDEDASMSTSEGPAYLQDDIQLSSLQAKLDYVSSALEFISALGIALPRLSGLISSKIVSDVVESMHFLASAVNFRVQDALEQFSQ